MKKRSGPSSELLVWALLLGVGGYAAVKFKQERDDRAVSPSTPSAAGGLLAGINLGGGGGGMTGGAGRVDPPGNVGGPAVRPDALPALPVSREVVAASGGVPLAWSKWAAIAHPKPRQVDPPGYSTQPVYRPDGTAQHVALSAALAAGQTAQPPALLGMTPGAVSTAIGSALSVMR